MKDKFYEISSGKVVIYFGEKSDELGIKLAFLRRSANLVLLLTLIKKFVSIKILIFIYVTPI